MQEETDFFTKIQHLGREKLRNDQCEEEDDSPIQRELRNKMCILWAFASNDDLLLYAARFHAELNRHLPLERLRELRRKHQLHLALNQKH